MMGPSGIPGLDGKAGYPGEAGTITMLLHFSGVNLY